MRAIEARLSQPCWYPLILAGVAAVIILWSPSNVIARTALVCLPAPAQCFTIHTSVIGTRRFEEYRVTNPDVLFVDTARRRSELALAPQQALAYCAVNPWAGIETSLPTLSFTRADVSLNESIFIDQSGIERNNELARVAFTAISTSDGDSHRGSASSSHAAEGKQSCS